MTATLSEIIRLGAGVAAEEAWDALGRLGAAVATLAKADNNKQHNLDAVTLAGQEAGRLYWRAAEEHAAVVRVLESYLGTAGARVPPPEDPR